jgi:putative transposase
MSEAISESTGKRYGLERVCRVWDLARSSVYERRQRAERRAEGALPGRRGPKPKCSDEEVLGAIQADLERSPFKGEGHRKVHARLRILDGIRVSRKRVLRVMRENSLLSPHRVRQGKAKKHDGKIITLLPNVMWGTDGARVFTVDDGWVWIFSAVEHWNAECVGWHVCKVGSRFAALEPIAQGLERIYGSVEADVARGLSLRMDHGSQYLSDHFQKQIRHWGITPSLRLRRGTRDQRCRRALQSNAQRAGDPRSSLQEHRGSARGCRQVRRRVQRVLAAGEARIQDAA